MQAADEASLPEEDSQEHFLKAEEHGIRLAPAPVSIVGGRADVFELVVPH